MTTLSNEQLRENAHHLYLCAIGKYAGDPQENIQNELHDILASQRQAILEEVATIEATYNWGDEIGLRRSLQKYLYEQRNILKGGNK